MEKQHLLHNDSRQYYSEMLQRQNPWLSTLLTEGEYPLALSFRKPEMLTGCCLTFIGIFLLLDTAFHRNAFDESALGPVLLIAGAVLLYCGIWALFFCRRSYVLVTSRRLLYQKITIRGIPGERLSIPRGDIQSARFFKKTVLYRSTSSAGNVLLTFQNGTDLLIPSLRDAESILGALHE